MSFEPRGCLRFNCGLGSLVIIPSNFPIGISNRDGTFAAGICDFVTFVELTKALGNPFVRSCK